MKKLFILLAAMLTFTSTAFAFIGSSDADLVFTPITPCRIVDTRTSFGGTGPIATGAVKGFIVWGTSSYASQGGSPTNCGIVAGSNTAAVAVSMAVVSPVGQGYLTAFPGNIADAAKPLAATLNYNAGEVVVSNAATLKVSQGASPDLKVFASNSTEVIIDVVGYYSRPVSAGSFTCTTTTGVTVPIAANSTATAFASSCPAAATLTGTNCRASSFDVFFAVSDNGQCSAKNTSGAAHTITAEVRCCQIPGR